jgi:hypothetical protein
MYVAHACPSCESARHREYPALVSPFVASYVLDAPPPLTRLLECKACGLRFFEHRFTSAEASKLYDGYRGERYYRARHRVEPWYTREVNDAIGGAPASIVARQSLIERVLGAHTDAARIERLLDYGGDRGQFIPLSVGRERFVYEISGVSPVEGVSCIASADDLAAQRFDAILLSHVLEHCSEPKEVLDAIRPLLRGQGSVLYVELPFERTELRWIGRGASYRGYLSALRHTGPLLTAVDLYSTALRVQTNTLPPLGFAKLHEHINFFDERSVRALLVRCGFDVVTTETTHIRSASGVDTVLVALARPR